MANVNASISINIKASNATGQLAALQAQLASLNKQMVSGAAAAGAAQNRMAASMANGLNKSGMWTASAANMMTATGRMAQQFDKGTMSFRQWQETSKRATRAMGDNAVMNQMAAQRVRALQTQYMALGREVDGTQKVMRMTPTGVMRDWNGEMMMAQQRAALFHRRLQMGANGMINWGKNTQWAGRQMMVGMSIPLGIAAVGAVAAFKDIEQASISFKRVYGDATTTAGEKAQMLGTIQKGVAQDMTKYGIAVSDTIGVAAKAAATGQKGNDLVVATRETMRLATLGQLDYDQALESTIATQTAFGVSTKGMTRVTDFLNAAENQTILSMDDMTKAIPRVAPVIRGLGGDVEDLGVLMTALRAGGVTAEQGANALKSGLASLINPTSSATEAMDSFGIPLEKIVNANKGDLIGTVQDFGKALAKLPKFEQQQALESLFGKYQYARMGALFRNINKEQAQETARLSKESSANLAKMSENELSQISDSAMNKFQGAVERLKAAAAPLGEAILSSLAPVVDIFAKVVDFFAGNDLARNVLLFGAAFAGLAGVAVMLTGVFANFFGTMMKGFLMARRGIARLAGRPIPAYQTLADLEAATAQKQLGAAATAAAKGLYAEAAAANVLAQALARLRGASTGIAGAVAGRGTRGSLGKYGIVGSAAGFMPRVAPGPSSQIVARPQIVPRTTPTSTGTKVRSANEVKGGAPPLVQAKTAQFAKSMAHYPVVTAAIADSLQKEGQRLGQSQQEIDSRIKNATQLTAAHLDPETRTTTGGVLHKDWGGRMTPEVQAINQWSQSVKAMAAAGPKASLGQMTGGKTGIEGLRALLGPKAAGYSEADFRTVASGAHPTSGAQAMLLRDLAAGVEEKRAGGFKGMGSAVPARAALDAMFGSVGKEYYDKLPEYNLTDEEKAKANSEAAKRQQAERGQNAATVANTRATEDSTKTTQKTSKAQADLTKAQTEHAAATTKTAAAEKELGKQTSLLARTKDPEKVSARRIQIDRANRDLERARTAEAAASRNVAKAQNAVAAETTKQTTAVPTTKPAAPKPAARVKLTTGTYQPQLTQRQMYDPSRMGAPNIFGKDPNKSSWWNRMRSGGVAGGGTRGMDPEQKALARSSKMYGASNAMMGVGMLGEMGLMLGRMTGHDIPMFADALPMAAMTLSMMPSLITEPAAMFKGGMTSLMGAFPAVGVAFGGIAAAGAALGFNFLYHKKITSDAIDAGKTLANSMVVSGKQINALGEVYGKQSIVESRRAEEAAKAYDVTKEQVDQGRQALESDAGKSIVQQAMDVVKGSGLEAGAKTLSNSLAQANLEGVMSAKESRGFLAGLSEDSPAMAAAAKREYGSLVGKGVGQDPVGVALKIQQQTAQSSMLAAASMKDQLVQAQQQYQQSGSYSSYSGMYGGGGGSGGNMAVESPALGAVASKYASFQGQIWSNSLEQQVRTRQAAYLRLLDLQERMNNAETPEQRNKLAQQYENGTAALKEFDKNAQSSWNRMQESWNASPESQGIMQEAINNSILDRYKDTPQAPFAEMGLQKLAESGATAEVQFRVSSVMASGAIRPDAFNRMMDMAGGAEKIDLAIGNTSSINEAGDFFNKLSEFDPAKFQKAASGAGKGFVQAAKYAGMTQKEAVGLADALDATQSQIDAVKKAFKGGGVKPSGKSKDAGDQESEEYDKGRNKSKNPTQGGGVKNSGKSGGEGDRESSEYDKGRNKSKKEVRGGGVKGDTGKAAAEGGKVGDAYAKAMQTKMNQISKSNAGPAPLKLGATVGAGAKVPAKSQSQTVKVNYKPGKMPKVKAQSVKLTYKAGKMPKAKPQSVKLTYKAGKQPQPKPQSAKVNYKLGSQVKPKAQQAKVNYNKGSQAKPDDKDATVNYKKGDQEEPEDKEATVNYTLGSQDVPQDKTASVNYRLGSQEPPADKTATVHYTKGSTGGLLSAGSLHLAGGGEPMRRGNFSGKKVYGPGGPTDDKVPAWLSPGEFVIRASSVDKYGTGFMSRLNSGLINPNSVVRLKDGSEEAKKTKKKNEGDGGDSGGGDKWKWKDVKKEIVDTFKAASRSMVLMNKETISLAVGKKNKKTKNISMGQRIAVQEALGDDPKALKKYLGMSAKERKETTNKIYKAKLKQDRLARQQEIWQAEEDAKYAAKLNRQRLKFASSQGDTLKQSMLGLTDEQLGYYENIKVEANIQKGMSKKKKNKARKRAKAQTDKKRKDYLRKVGERNALESYVSESSDLTGETQLLRAQTQGSITIQGVEITGRTLENLSAAQLNLLNTLPADKAKEFAQALSDATQASVDAENAARSREISAEKGFAGRFDNAAVAGLNDRAMANLSQEDYERLIGMNPADRQAFIDSLNDLADANYEAEQAAEALAEKLEYLSMSAGEQGAEMSNLLGQKSDIVKNYAAAKGDQEIQNSTLGDGRYGSQLTRAQIEARMQQDQATVARLQFEQTKGQQAIDDINKAYDEQSKLLEKISSAQQIISNLQRGRLSVASALSSGDIAAAAAAAQEQRAAESQANMDLMKQALQDEKERKIDEYQDKIDEAQDSIDALNNSVTSYQIALDEITSKWAVGGADAASAIDKANTNLQANHQHYQNLLADVQLHIDRLIEVNKQWAAYNAAVGAVNPVAPNTPPAPPPAPAPAPAPAPDPDLLAAAPPPTQTTPPAKTPAPTPAPAVDNDNDAARWQRFSNRFDNLNAVEKTKVIKAAFKNQTDNKKNKERYLSWSKEKQQRLNSIVDKGNITNAEEKELERFALGGWVGGLGNGDIVPAMLTPGEFVVNKRSAARFGGYLEKINSPSYRIASSAGMASSSVGQSGGNVYNLTVNAGSNASADDIATITIKRIKEMESRSIRSRSV